MGFECILCKYSTNRKYNLEIHNKSVSHLKRVDTENELLNYILWSKKIKKVHYQFHNKCAFPRHRYEFKETLKLLVV